MNVLLLVFMMSILKLYYVPPFLCLASVIFCRGLYYRLAALLLLIISSWACYWAFLRPGCETSGCLAGLLPLFIYPPVLVVLLTMWLMKLALYLLDKRAMQSESLRKTFRDIDGE